MGTMNSLRIRLPAAFAVAALLLSLPLLLGKELSVHGDVYSAVYSALNIPALCALALVGNVVGTHQALNAHPPLLLIATSTVAWALVGFVLAWALRGRPGRDSETT
jgi:hypothetical protein